MTDTTAQEAELLETAANCLKGVDGDNPLEVQQMYATTALACTTLAGELRVRRGPPAFKMENDEEFEERVRRSHERWDAAPAVVPPAQERPLIRFAKRAGL